MLAMQRICSRAEKRRKGQYVKLRGICHGELSAILPFSYGSAIGQTPQPQPISSNYLLNTAAPSTTGSWTENGAAVLTLDTLNQFDAGFYPIIAQTTATSGYLECLATISGSLGTFTASAYFSVDSRLNNY